MAKNLNDAIHGDRSIISGKSRGANRLDSWDDWEKNKAAKGLGFKDPIANFDHDFAKGSVVKKYNDYKVGTSCYHKHPALKLPGTDLVIYGGSCNSPAMKDADVYVGFDHGMQISQRHWPWKKGTEVLFEVQDMGIPKQPEEFRKLVGWVKKQVDAGLKVHCGCIGGHGRTGTFLAALVSEYGEKDAINYVRKNYCDRAVESSQQVKFLQEQYGVKKSAGSKSGGSHSSYSSSTSSKATKIGSGGRFTPIESNGSIWKQPF
jgi:hypothetical protein